MRYDAQTCSVLGFYLTLAFGAHPGWTLCSADASCAFLQSKGIERWLLLRMPRNHPPPGTLSEQVLLAMGSIYGTRDAPRAWYKHLRETLLAEAFVECQLEKSMHYRRRGNETMMVLLVHVDDL